MSTPDELAAAAATGALAENGRPYGYVGMLTKEQQECLRNAWDGLLAFFEDDQSRLAMLDLTDAFDDIKLHKKVCTPTLSPTKDSIASDEETPKEGGFWSGLSNTLGITTIMTSPSSDASQAPLPESNDPFTSNDREVSREELCKAFWDGVMLDHPDTIILRFLRAHKWNVARALNMILAMFQWRVQEDVAGIIREGEHKINKHMFDRGQPCFYGVDKKQQPICIINASNHNSELQPIEDVKHFTIWMMETSRLMLSQPEGRVDILFDLADFTMVNLDYNFIKFIIRCFQAYYPESLGVYMVANPPWIFWGVWKVIQPWLDPVVAEKFFLANKLTDLQEYIDPSWLPVSLGGDNTYEFHYPPMDSNEDFARLHDAEGRAIRQAALTKLHERFTAETRKWIQDASATNSPAIKLRDVTATEIRAAYLQLDPYIRSRTVYHRLGVLTEDGVCDWSRLRRD